MHYYIQRYSNTSVGLSTCLRTGTHKSLQDWLHGLNILCILHATCASKAQQQFKLPQSAEVLDVKFFLPVKAENKNPQQKVCMEMVKQTNQQYCTR